MAHSDAFSVKIFSPAGFERAFRTVELDNWNGKGVMSKRSIFVASQKREEFSRPGVYIIYGKNEPGEMTRVYIGEGDPVLPRLQEHHKKKDFWTDLISFSASDKGLTKAHIKYLEAKLVTLAFNAKTCKLENDVKPSLPTLPESEVAYADRFVENILDCLAILNITFFHIPDASTKTDEIIFELSGKGAHARGFRSENGFTVLKDSTATNILTNAFSGIKGVVALRDHLVASGVMEKSEEVMKFTQNYEFDSPSAAGQIIYGNPINGRESWKTRTGQTLKSIQESEVIENVA